MANGARTHGDDAEILSGSVGVYGNYSVGDPWDRFDECGRQLCIDFRELRGA